MDRLTPTPPGRDRTRLVPVGDPGAGPYALTTGPDGALWATVIHAGQIARADPAGGVVLHTLDSATCRPSQIVAGADDALWFTRAGDDRIGRITLDGTATSFAVDPGSAPFGITSAPGDALWFTAMGSDRIGRVTTDGELAWLDLPTTGAMASMITTAPDGALWVTLNQGNAIARVGTDRRVTVHLLPTPQAGPVGITATRDAVWFTEIAAGQIGRIDANGHIDELALPDRDARPHAILAHPDGRVMFTEWATARLGCITPAGDLRHVALPQASEPHGLTIAPDGAVWVALEIGSLVRLTI